MGPCRRTGRGCREAAVAGCVVSARSATSSRQEVTAGPPGAWTWPRSGSRASRWRLAPRPGEALDRIPAGRHAGHQARHPARRCRSGAPRRSGPRARAFIPDEVRLAHVRLITLLLARPFGSPCAISRASAPPRSHRPSSSPRRPWPSASPAASARSSNTEPHPLPRARPGRARRSPEPGSARRLPHLHRGLRGRRPPTTWSGAIWWTRPSGSPGSSSPG